MHQYKQINLPVQRDPSWNYSTLKSPSHLGQSLDAISPPDVRAVVRNPMEKKEINNPRKIEAKDVFQGYHIGWNRFGNGY
jgi:hypothetical protein